MEVTLTKQELVAAMQAGAQDVVRRLCRLIDNEADLLDVKNTEYWTEGVKKAAGSLAVAKAAGRYWDVSTGEVDMSWIVCLSAVGWLHCDDDPEDDAVLILVDVDRLPVVEIRGWLRGAELKRPEHLAALSDPKESGYSAPLAALHPFEELIA